MDADKVTEILEDVREECQKYGSVIDVKIPRPSGGSRQSNGVGKIYVKYDVPASAQKALQALAGRKFADRTVVVTFFGEVSLVLHCRRVVTNEPCRNTLTSTLGRRDIGSGLPWTFSADLMSLLVVGEKHVH